MSEENYQEESAPQPRGQEDTRIDVAARMEAWRADEKKEPYPAEDVKTGEKLDARLQDKGGEPKKLKPADPEQFDKKLRDQEKDAEGEEDAESDEAEEEGLDNPYGVEEDAKDAEDTEEDGDEDKRLEEKLTKMLGMKTDELKELRFQKSELERERAEIEDQRKELETLRKQYEEIAQVKRQEDFAKKADQRPRFDFTPEEIVDDESQPDYLRQLAKDDPDMVRAVSHMLNDHFGNMIEKASEHSQLKTEQAARDQEVIVQQITSAIDRVKKEDKFDLEKLWSSPEFTKYGEDPENESVHQAYVKRFGFGTPEYFRHLRDDFLGKRKKYLVSASVKASRAKSKNAGSKQADGDDPMSRYAEYQEHKKRSKP